MYIIYCHTNRLTEKQYVGLTKRSLEKRWAGHLKDVRNGSTYKFHRSIRKHGMDVWDHDVLCEGIDTLDNAKHLEFRFIEMLGTYENGYNMTLGGEGGTLSYDERKRRSERMKGQKKSATTRARMRAYALSRPAEHNRKVTEGFMRWAKDHPEHYEKVGALRWKAVAKCDLCGNIIEMFPSVKAAGQALNVSPGNIATVARGERNHCAGFLWRYVESNNHDK